MSSLMTSTWPSSPGIIPWMSSAKNSAAAAPPSTAIKGTWRKNRASAWSARKTSRRQVSLLKLSSFLDHVERRVEAAAADGDTDRVYKGSHIGSRIIHQINKMDVPLELDTAYRLLSSPGLVSRDSILPTAPKSSPLCTRPWWTKPWPPARPRQRTKLLKRCEAPGGPARP